MHLFSTGIDDRILKQRDTAKDLLGDLLMNKRFWITLITVMMLSASFVSCGSDVVAQYVLLATLYTENGMEEAKKRLVVTVEQMESNRKDAILKALENLETAASDPVDETAGLALGETLDGER